MAQPTMKELISEAQRAVDKARTRINTVYSMTHNGLESRQAEAMVSLNEQLYTAYKALLAADRDWQRFHVAGGITPPY